MVNVCHALLMAAIYRTLPMSAMAEGQARIPADQAAPKPNGTEEADMRELRMVFGWRMDFPSQFESAVNPQAMQFASLDDGNDLLINRGGPLND